eukprot:EG_transcript_196
MRRSLFQVSLLTLLVLLGNTPWAAAKNIKVAVKAWKETSLFAEAAEFFAEQEASSFWPFVEAVSSSLADSPGAEARPSQQRLYREVLAYSQRAQSQHGTNALKYALSLRYYSPVVEAQYQFSRKYLGDYPQTGASDCFAVVPGVASPFFAVPPLVEHLTARPCPSSTPPPELFPIDHSFGPVVGDTHPVRCNVTVVLHCDIGSAEFRGFHNWLSAQAGLSYVLRHHLAHHFAPGTSDTYPSLGAPPANQSAEWQAQLAVQGYGVELQIKNMEYKNIDEKTPPTGADAERAGEGEGDAGDDEATVVDYGFNFELLLRRRPDLRESLTELRERLVRDSDSLRTGEDDSEDIKVWQLQNLGHQASAKILQAADPLEALGDIAQNFPKRAGAISRISPASKRYAAVVRELQRNRRRLGVQEGASHLYINGRAQPIDTLTPFDLFAAVNSDGRLVSTLSALLQPVLPAEASVGPVVQALLQTPMSSVGPARVNPYTGQKMQSGPETRFGFKPAMVDWMNDIEKDPRYRRWPLPLGELLQPSFFGQVRYCRRNLYTSIFIIDPTQKEQLLTVPMMQRFLAQDAPTRVGVVLVCPDTLRALQRQRVEEDAEVLASDKALEQRVLAELAPAAPAAAAGQRVRVTAEGRVEAEAAEPPAAGAAPSEEAGADSSPPAQAPRTLAMTIIALFRHLAQKDRDTGFDFLSRLHAAARGENVTEAEVEAAWFAAAPSRDRSRERLLEIAASPSADAALQKSMSYVVDRGFTATPLCLFNGLLMQGKTARDAFFAGMQAEQPYVRELIREGVLYDKQKDVYRAILDHTGAQNRFSPQVFGPADFRPSPPGTALYAAAQYVTAGPPAGPGAVADVTHLLVVDCEAAEGLAAVAQALSHFVAAAPAKTRLAFVYHPQRAAMPVAVALEALLAATAGRPQQPGTALQFVGLVRKALLAGSRVDTSALRTILVAMNDAQRSPESEPSSGNAYQQRQKLPVSFDLTVALQHLDAGQGSAQLRGLLALHAQLGRSLGASPALLTNGRLLHLSGEAALLAEDYGLLEAFERQHRTANLLKVLARHHVLAAVEAAPAETGRVRLLEDALPQLLGHLAHDSVKNGERTADMPAIPAGLHDPRGPLSGFAVPAKEATKAPGEATILDVVAVVDPLSAAAQKLSTFLASLHDAFHAHITVHLNPVSQLSALPLKSFYRYVLTPELQFDPEAGTIVPPSAYFTNVVESKILTMGVEEPESWIIMSQYAPADLDNIRLADFEGRTLYAEYELEHLVVTGGCIDVTQNAPPRGLELVMTNDASAADTQDTLVMSNFGYFQLKGFPGIWRLGLKPKSRGERIFEIAGQFTIQTNQQEGTMRPTAVTNVIMHRFTGEYLYLKVTRREGMESAELLAEDEPVEEAAPPAEPPPADGVWGKFSSLLGKGREPPAKRPAAPRAGEPTLNIFSLASGHLYERLLKVMIHTVTNYTAARPDSHVKFWFVKNFLSPQFKRFLPHMAAKWNFSFELVTYKWPKWLRRQTEKQRTIWAYKILFLDVLFPLSLDKVIFVDADQIVRTDLHELYERDLQGKALAYTPFCDSRKETEGFRFWKQGYWYNHLRGAPYHISALYVVDIKRFRQMAAGDNYRMIYDELTADPNSLANLDQDLPNYAQYLIGIHSLDQEWLWCETWCSDESKPRAKTIDLCNNPLTKVPKLDNARRIIPEWDDYDQHIRRFEDSLGLPKY